MSVGYGRIESGLGGSGSWVRIPPRRPFAEFKSISYDRKTAMRRDAPSVSKREGGKRVIFPSRINTF
jgi:hypothetical protein